MKRILFYLELAIYVIYLGIVLIVLIPYAKSSINVSGGGSYKYVAYALTFLPFLLGSFFVYKSYKSLDRGIFYLYFLLAIIFPIIIVPFNMFLMS